MIGKYGFGGLLFRFDKNMYTFLLRYEYGIVFEQCVVLSLSSKQLHDLNRSIKVHV